MNTIKPNDLTDFDTADFLKTEEDIAAYLSVVLEENDPNALIDALNTISRAKGMGYLAQKTGLARESLYRSLRPDAKPRMETILKILQGIGIKLTAQPLHQEAY